MGLGLAHDPPPRYVMVGTHTHCCGVGDMGSRGVGGHRDICARFPPMSPKLYPSVYPSLYRHGLSKVGEHPTTGWI